MDVGGGVAEELPAFPDLTIPRRAPGWPLPWTTTGAVAAAVGPFLPICALLTAALAILLQMQPASMSFQVYQWPRWSPCFAVRREGRSAQRTAQFHSIPLLCPTDCCTSRSKGRETEREQGDRHTFKEQAGVTRASIRLQRQRNNRQLGSAATVRVSKAVGKRPSRQHNARPPNREGTWREGTGRGDWTSSGCE